jgi:ADP-ribose pyrophosphatase YjhB (NUDIX family)
MPQIRHKVLAYVTHGDRLLLFRHPRAPEAGIQVVGGSLKIGERPVDGAIREAREETGLTDLVLVGPLGEDTRDLADLGSDETHHRSFVHLRCTDEPPATWQHEERDPSDGSPAPILFEFFWARLPDKVPPLIADHDRFLPRLIERLTIEGIIGPIDGSD